MGRLCITRCVSVSLSNAQFKIAFGMSLVKELFLISSKLGVTRIITKHFKLKIYGAFSILFVYS